MISSLIKIHKAVLNHVSIRNASDLEIGNSSNMKQITDRNPESLLEDALFAERRFRLSHLFSEVASSSQI